MKKQAILGCVQGHRLTSPVGKREWVLCMHNSTSSALFWKVQKMFRCYLQLTALFINCFFILSTYPISSKAHSPYPSIPTPSPYIPAMQHLTGHRGEQLCSAHSEMNMSLATNNCTCHFMFNFQTEKRLKFCKFVYNGFIQSGITFLKITKLMKPHILIKHWCCFSTKHW